MSLTRLGSGTLILFICLSAAAQTPDPSIQEKMQKALELSQSGDLKGAETLFREIIRDHPRHGSARLHLGRLCLARQSLEEAEEHLLVATTSDTPPPRLFLAWYLLGRVRFLKENYDGATEAFREATERAPSFKPAWLMLGETAERKGDCWEALRVYREILEKAPAEPEVQARMANLARAMGAHELAESAARQAIAGEPDNGAHYYLLAVIQKDSGQIDAAVKSCETALELGFREAPVYLTLGDLHYERMELSQSIAALAKAVELDPAAAESISSFALSSLTTEDFAALLSLLEKHLEAHPENLNTLYSLGVMYLRENDLGKAKDYFLRLEELAPDHTQVHYNLGLIYMREGEVEKGQAHMARFQDLKVLENEEFQRHNAAFRKRQEAQDSIAAGEPEKAIPIYTEMMKEKTAEQADVIALCNVYLTLRQTEPAFSCFNRVLEFSPYEKEALAGLAEAAEALDQTEVVDRCREHLRLLSPPEQPSHE